MFGVTRCATRRTARLALNVRRSSALAKTLPSASSSHVLSCVTPEFCICPNHTVVAPITISSLKYSTDVAEPIEKRIGRLVNENKVVVFMKGTPAAPKCGFSNAVMQILRMHGVKDFQSHNILEDDDLRQGIKEFSNWPTIPQVYFGGEFVGGCDIMIEMHQKGELIEELKKIGILSALLDKPDPDKSE